MTSTSAEFESRVTTADVVVGIVNTNIQQQLTLDTAAAAAIKTDTETETSAKKTVEVVEEIACIDYKLVNNKINNVNQHDITDNKIEQQTQQQQQIHTNKKQLGENCSYDKKMDNDSSFGNDEKCDAPEILDKTEQDIPHYHRYQHQDDVDGHDDHLHHDDDVTAISINEKVAFAMDTSRKLTSKTKTATPIEEIKLSNEKYSKQSYAFTIDNSETAAEADAKAAKYKSMLERFQNRHKRSASVSKIENSIPIPNTPLVNESINMKKSTTPSSTTTTTPTITAITDNNKILMRGRSAPRTTKDFGKRRSWSPRAFEQSKEMHATTPTTTKPTGQRWSFRQNNLYNNSSGSKVLERDAYKMNRLRATNKNNCTDDEHEKQRFFIPRSKAMQLALKKVCTQPLVDNFKQYNIVHVNADTDANADADADNISDTGTYTLDGDNYTEEQKDQMNIDKSSRESKYNKYNNMLLLQQSPTSTTTTTTTTTTTEPHQNDEQQIEDHLHLDVAAATAADDDADDDDEDDVGYITSVTTSGVLAKSTANTNKMHSKFFTTTTTTQLNAIDYKQKQKKILTNNNKKLTVTAVTKKLNETRCKPTFAKVSNAAAAAAAAADTAILKTAQTKKDWVQEWARNARARSLANDYVSADGYEDLSYNLTSPVRTKYNNNNSNIMTQSYTGSVDFAHNQNLAKRYFLHGMETQSDHVSDTLSLSLRSPRMQQTKIPSPMHSTRRSRSTSRLNGMESPLPRSPTHLTHSLPLSAGLQRSSLVYTQLQPQKQAHINKYGNLMTGSYNEQQMSMLTRTRKNSLDGKMHASPLQQQRAALHATPKSASSNNFNKMYEYYDDELAYYVQDLDEELSGSDHDHDDGVADGEDALLTVSDDPILASHYAKYQQTLRKLNTHAQDFEPVPPVTATRYNKTLLMRIQNSKNKTNDNNNMKMNGTAACPNTPELPRRGVKLTGGLRTRAGGAYAMRSSEPRDTSLSRREVQVPKSLALAKKHLLQTAAATATELPIPITTPTAVPRVHSAGSGSVQPKYLDISKFKQAQANQFLRKNEARSTLKTPTNNSNVGGMKRSPSASGLSRTDSIRGSKNSIRSVPNCMTSSGTALSGNVKMLGFQLSGARDNSKLKQKEAEMAMWKRRSTYDPMRAAAEDRRRKEELKRQQLK